MLEVDLKSCKMEYIAESIALGIDSLILAFCIKKYYKNKNAMAMIQVRLFLKCILILISNNLGSTLLGHKQGTERYCRVTS